VCVCVCVSQRECVNTLKIWKRSEKEWKRKTNRERGTKKFSTKFFQNENEKLILIIIEVGSRRALSIKRTSINHDAPHERREEE